MLATTSTIWCYNPNMRWIKGEDWMTLKHWSFNLVFHYFHNRSGAIDCNGLCKFRENINSEISPHTLLQYNSCLHRSFNALTTLKRLCQPMFSWQRNAKLYRIKTDSLHFLTYASLHSPPQVLTSISSWPSTRLSLHAVRIPDNWSLAKLKGETCSSAGKYLK